MLQALDFVDEAFEWVSATAFDWTSYDTAYPPKDRKWLVRSALQKAIRRGWVETAMRHALALSRIDADYAWRALATISVEDIGVGSPEAVTFSNLAMLKTFRERMEPARLLTALVVAMCAADKSRSCCELSTAGDLAHRDQIERMANLELPALWPFIKSPDLVSSYAALCAMRGQLPRGMPGLPRSMKDRDDAGVWLAEGLPRLHGLAAVASFDRPTDLMMLAYAPTAMLAQTQVLQLTADEMPESCEIGGFAAEAWDIHCREGKVALKAFHTSLVKVYPEMRSEIMPARVAQALGAVVFVVEGCLVDRRLTSPEFRLLQRDCDAALMMDAGVPRAFQARAVEIVRNELGRLNQKRRWVCSALGI